MTDGDMSRGGTDHGGPYEAKVSLWEVDYDADVDRPGEAERRQRTVEGFYDEPTPIDVVNAILYDLRGRKSSYELAYIDEIRPVDTDTDRGPTDDGRRYVWGLDDD